MTFFNHHFLMKIRANKLFIKKMKFQKKSSILNVDSEEELAAAGVFYISEKKEKRYLKHHKISKVCCESEFTFHKHLFSIQMQI